MQAALPVFRSRPRGFTLIELMIAVVVVAVLAALAMPSVMSSIRKSRRTDAFTAITAVQQAQERWRSNHSSYTDQLSDLGLSATSSSGHYTIALGSATATGYTVTATGKSSSSQAADSCSVLGTKLASGSLTYAGCEACSTPTFTATNPCWSR